MLCCTLRAGLQSDKSLLASFQCLMQAAARVQELEQARSALEASRSAAAAAETLHENTEAETQRQLLGLQAETSQLQASIHGHAASSSDLTCFASMQLGSLHPLELIHVWFNRLRSQSCQQLPNSRISTRTVAPPHLRACMLTWQPCAQSWKPPAQRGIRPGSSSAGKHDISAAGLTASAASAVLRISGRRPA